MELKLLNRITANHPFLEMAKDIDEIIQPLKKFGIHLFSYRKTFADGSRINFSNNANWLYYSSDKVLSQEPTVMQQLSPRERACID